MRASQSLPRRWCNGMRPWRPRTAARREPITRSAGRPAPERPEARLGRIVGAVGLHEHDGLGAGGDRRTGSGEAGIAVAAPRLTHQGAAGALDVLGSVVGRAVVHEGRAPQQVEGAQFAEQRRQRRCFVQDGHHDAPLRVLGLRALASRPASGSSCDRRSGGSPPVHSPCEGRARHSLRLPGPRGWETRRAGAILLPHERAGTEGRGPRS